MKRSPAAAAAAIALSALCGQAAAAAGFADPAEIDRAVIAFTGTGAGGVAVPVDRRLRLAPCRQPLALGWRGDHRDTVLVQCPDADGWRLFVPMRGGAADSRPAPAGPAAVARGEEVTVAITGDGFTVSQSGEALESGAVGDWIRVSPMKDAKVASEPIRAQIVRPGMVAVLLP